MTVFTDKSIKYIPRLMTDLQIDRIQACGIFGNLGTETGGFTALQEKSPIIKGSKGGYGWMQWTGPRRKKYEKWCADMKLDPAADETNYRYLVLETKTDEAHSLAQLKKTTTLEAATETFMAQNLRPGKPNLQDRIKYAHAAYDATASISKENKITGAVVGTVATGVVVGSSIPATVHQTHHVWGWVALGVAVAIGLLWWAIHEYHKSEENQAKAPEVPQKGKRNG